LGIESVDTITDMENAKSLIIIKPMSAPLQKLYEVLSGVAVEENIEIIVIDSLKEAAQLFSMGGQYLTLVSDPKQCALFLQENRTSYLARHSKTLLFTPKVIQPKILDKFIKLGLTENVLDTAQPKTLLFKVKLLLKSLKANDSKESAAEKQDQHVKSMLDLTQAGAISKKTSLKEDAESASIATADPKKKKIEIALEGGLDYLTNLKKKNAYQDEAIQTNWSSKKRLNDDLITDEDKSEDIKKSESNEENIDGYIRGKSTKSVSIELFDNQADSKDKKTPFLNEEFESKEKKQFIELELDNSKEKKTKEKIAEEELERNSKIKSLNSTEITLDAAEKKAKREEEEKTAELDKKAKKKEQEELLLEDNGRAKKDKSANEANTDKNMYGKLRPTTSLDLEEGEAAEKEKKEYEKEKERAERQKDRELELELEKSARKKADDVLEAERSMRTRAKVDSSDLAESEENDLKKSEDDDLDEEEKSKRRKQTELQLEHSKNKNKEKLTEAIDQDLELAATDEINIVNNQDSKDQDDNTSDALGDDGEELKKKKITELMLTDSKSSIDKDKIEAEKKERQKKDGLAIVEEGEDTTDKNREKGDNSDNDFTQKAKSKQQIELELESSKKHHDGTTEKIDSYMRGGEARREEQDWTQKKKVQDTTLKLFSSSQDEIDIKRYERRDAGEITIDYRLLREEFSDLAKSGYKQNSVDQKALREDATEDEDENSYKVIELKANGFDFAISIINQYYNPEILPATICKNIAQKFLSDEKAYCVFYTFSGANNEHKETYNSFKELPPSPLDYWNTFKSDEASLEYLYSKTMSTWVCREIKEKDSFWSDNELPNWAAQELQNKVVEYIYPFYDGLDRIGMGYLYFPEGIQSKNEKKIIILLELLRGIFLDSAKRNSTKENAEEIVIQEKKTDGVLGIIGSFFGKKKTG
jgi:hypothetical protein